MGRLEVYCDGSVSPARMNSLTSSNLDTAFVGRIVVLIPELDFGSVKKIKEGAMTANGNPASTQVEILAVKRAKDICVEKQLREYVILTDNSTAAQHSAVEEVQWLDPGKLHYASLFLERIMNRARYLRQSSRKVVTRAEPNKLQAELFQLFNADKTEFQLSKSLLWNKIQMEMSAVSSSPVAGP